MTNGITMGAGLLALGIVSIAPAAAQPIYSAPPPGYHPMPGIAPGHVLAIVRSAGLRPLTQPARRGPRYLILAADRYGQQLRVVVDAHGGRILRIAPAYDPRFAGPAGPPAGAAPVPQRAGPPPMPPEVGRPQGDAVGGPLVAPPPGAAPNPRLAGVPPVTVPGARQPAEPRPARTP
jgi:hypothetical protein